MKAIKYGKVLTYKELATKIGKPKAYRAVGNACGANKIPIVVPCHRVVSSTGLGGFGGGIRRKKFLLNLESN
jgi:methylated-DNA-[protein]-cysteine S-methyltransferase